VLRDARAGRRGDDRGRGRDVDRAGAVAARARRVDEVVALRRTGSTCSRIASAQPAISSAVSPFSRSATRKPPICAGVASPRMISSITSRQRRAARSVPSSSSASASWIT
jgi:hypothetical protein